MNLIDRYISAVAQQLPASRRDDITRELKANILDRLESFAGDHGRPTTRADESAILRELGHPRQVAAAYLPQRQLVSPSWFPFYAQCLSYASAIVVLVQILALGAALLGEGHANIGTLLGGVTHGLLTMFACITGVFYVLSNLPATAHITPYCGWRPEQLPPVKQPWQRISMVHSVSEFAGNLFFLLFLHYPLWIKSETLVSLPITIGPGLQTWIIPLSIATAIALAINLVNLRHAYWTPTKLKLSIFLRLVVGALCVAIILTPEKLIQIGSAQAFSIANQIIMSVFVFAVGVSLIEAGRSVYRLNLLNKITE